jgi:predicted metalloprotease
MTTRDQIANWFDRGVAHGKRYMLVICDTFDYEDYPSYFDAENEAREVAHTPGEMQRVMEAYDLHADKAAQLNERRANCFAGKAEERAQ